MIYLRAWRLAAGYPSQDELAAAAGVPQSTISLLESGATASPTLAIAVPLVAALNQRLPAPISSDDLLHAPPVAAPPAEVAAAGA